MGRPRIIAIDGPAGSGKSSAARLLARRLGYLYLDSGALYRAVGWKALREGLDPGDVEGIRRLLGRTQIHLNPGAAGEAAAILVDGVDVTSQIRTPEVSRAASAVAAIPAVRERLLETQREVARKADRGSGIVAEGRDMGTVVFPEADLKFYLDASPDVRVKRRQQELNAAGRAADLKSTEAELNRRDQRDSTRASAPLRPAAGAIRIDSSLLDLEAVVAALWASVQKGTGLRRGSRSGGTEPG